MNRTHRDVLLDSLIRDPGCVVTGAAPAADGARDEDPVVLAPAPVSATGACTARDVLIVDGSANAIAASMACPELVVVGVPVPSGVLPVELLKGRRVFILVSPSAHADEMRHMWDLQARCAGASRVLHLRAMADGDPHSIAATLGYQELALRLP